MTHSWIFLAVLFLAMTGVVNAQFDWKSNGSGSNWSTANHWGGSVAPSPGVPGIFTFTTGHDITPTNDLVGVIAQSITFGTPNTAYAYTLGGNSINLSGNVLNSSSVLQTINMPLGLTAAVSFGGGTGGLTIGGVISGGQNVATTGKVTFLAANTFSGTTTISSGTLSIGTAGSLSSTTNVTVNSGGTLLLSGTNNDKINNSATVTLAGGTLTLGGSASLSETVGVLTLSSTSTIDFGTLAGGNTLTFANSSGASWSGTLNVYNWTQGSDHLFFGSSDTGLTSTQLSHISFYSDSGTTLLSGAGKFGLGTGEVRPTPEPSALLVGVGLCMMVCYREGWFRRRRRLPLATPAA